MHRSKQVLSPSEVARRLGVSTRALRLYEQRGLIAPLRTAAGWRTYGPKERARAAEIMALRSLGLGLAEVSRVLGGNLDCLEPALAGHQARLEGEQHRFADLLERLRAIRSDLACGRVPSLSDSARLARPESEVSVAFDLP